MFEKITASIPTVYIVNGLDKIYKVSTIKFSGKKWETTICTPFDPDNLIEQNVTDDYETPIEDIDFEDEKTKNFIIYFVGDYCSWDPEITIEHASAKQAEEKHDMIVEFLREFQGKSSELPDLSAIDKPCKPKTRALKKTPKTTTSGQE